MVCQTAFDGVDQIDALQLSVQQLKAQDQAILLRKQVVDLLF